MKTRSKLTWKIGGFALSACLRVWMQTLDFQAALYDTTIDPADDDFRGPCIYVFWHDQIMFCVYLRSHSNIAMLLSKHGDAQWLDEATRHLGFTVVRGSTNRGGVAALRELMRQSEGMNLAVTPDGPRGPRRKLAPGVIYLSSKLQIPLVCLGLAYQRPWRLPTWDRFAIPKPFSRARAVCSPFMQIPAELDRGEVEAYRMQVEQMLNFCTDSAQTWADNGGRYVEQKAVARKPAPRMPFGRLRSPADVVPDEVPVDQVGHKAA